MGIFDAQQAGVHTVNKTRTLPPYLDPAVQGATQASTSAFDQYAPNQTALGGLQSMAGLNAGNIPGFQSSQNYFGQLMQGDYLYGGAAFDRAQEAAANRLIPQVTSAFGRANRGSGELGQQELMRVLGDSFASMYQNERALQNQGLGMAPAMAQMAYLPSEMQYQAGTREYGLEQQGLNDYLSRLRSIGDVTGYSESESQPFYENDAANLLGLGLSGAGLLNELFGKDGFLSGLNPFGKATGGTTPGAGSDGGGAPSGTPPTGAPGGGAPASGIPTTNVPAYSGTLGDAWASMMGADLATGGVTGSGVYGMGIPKMGAATGAFDPAGLMSSMDSLGMFGGGGAGAAGAGGAFTGAGANAAATAGEMSFAGAPISSAGAPGAAGGLSLMGGPAGSGLGGIALGPLGLIAGAALMSGMGDHSRVKANRGRLEGQMIKPLQAAMNRGDSHTYLNVGGKPVLVEVKPINTNSPGPGEMGQGIYSKNGWLHSQGLYAVVDDQGNRTGEYVTSSRGKVSGWPMIVSKNDPQWARGISMLESQEGREEQANRNFFQSMKDQGRVQPDVWTPLGKTPPAAWREIFG
jgi:hypothetical protein